MTDASYEAIHSQPGPLLLLSGCHIVLPGASVPEPQPCSAACP